MSFARRALVTILVIQILVIVREVVFAIGLDRFLGAISREPPFAIVAVIFFADLALLVPVWRGNRWATLATLPLIALLLVAALPIWMFVFGSPTQDNFAVWFTLTVGVLSAAVGIPISVLAILESFGRRKAAPAGPGFSVSSMFAVGVTAALLGMATLAVAVAASPREGGASFERPPDAYAEVTMRDLRFTPELLQLQAGEVTAVFLTNEDGFEHSFDIDSADIHVTLAANETKVVMISAAAGETLDVYCAIPGHRDSGMVAQIVGN